MRSNTNQWIFPLVCLLSALVNLTSVWGIGTVVIDAGHGGKDHGGCYGKIYEKHLALDTAMRVEYLLKQKGYKTRMTRDSDRFLSLAKRSSIGNRYSRSVFVSIHYNHAARKGASGLETFYYSSKSRALASLIQDGMLDKVRAENRGVKHGRFYVLRHTRNPSVLVECGFVSNYGDRSKSKKGWYRQALAEGIVNGIVRYDQRH